jgi:hypothetical protein
VAIVIHSRETTKNGELTEKRIFMSPQPFELFVSKCALEHRLYPSVVEESEQDRKRRDEVRKKFFQKLIVMDENEHKG